jgi:hypothetical protein
VNRDVIEYDQTEVKVRAEPLHPVIWQGRQWAVTSYGLECRDGAYTIEAKRLAEGLRGEHPYSWVAHVGKKLWCDVDDFATAYLLAVAMHGVRLTKAGQALVMSDRVKAIVSHEKSDLFREMFPGRPGERFQITGLIELDRQCKAVDVEYRRRKGL